MGAVSGWCDSRAVLPQRLTGAVLMLECADVGQANKALNMLPLVEQGLIAFDIIPLAPYPGFARLFVEDR